MSSRIEIPLSFRVGVRRPVGGYRIRADVSVKESGTGRPLTVVEPIGEHVEWNPLTKEPLLFLKAADVSESLPAEKDARRAAILDFAGKYGPVRGPKRTNDPNESWMILEDWDQGLTEVAWAVNQVHVYKADAISDLESPVELSFLRYRAESELNSIANLSEVQLIHAVARGDQFHRCPECSKWIHKPFERTGPPPAYCSNACKVRSYKKRKKRAREFHASGMTPAKIAKELGSTTETVKGWLKKR